MTRFYRGAILSVYYPSVIIRFNMGILIGAGFENTIESPRGKTNNVVSEQVWHKLACTSTEKS